MPASASSTPPSCKRVGDGERHAALARRAARTDRPRAPAGRRRRTPRRPRRLAQAFRVQRELPAQLFDFGLHRCERASVVGRGEHARDELGDLIHLGFAHAARGHRRRAEADAAGHHRRILIEGDRVLVDGDAGLAERGLGDLAGDALREHVDEHDVVVGAAADDAEAGGCERRGQPLGVGDDLLLIGGELRRRRFLEAHRLGRDDVHQRPALHAGEHRAIEVLRVLLRGTAPCRRAGRAASCAWWW